MKLSDYVIDFLVAKGVTHVFEVCGGSLAHLLDSLYGRMDISTVSMHHETAAAFAAEGYSRACGNIGVAMATSGPGATNFVTGIGSCYFDSIPCLFITGQVNTYEFKFDKPTRQIGFQETDIVKIVKPITKKAELLMDEHRVRYCLQEAIYEAENGRPGPVLLDIPLNIQRASIDVESLVSFDDGAEAKCKSGARGCGEIVGCTEGKSNIDDKIIEDRISLQVIDLIKASARPIILAGGGVRLAGAREELLTFARRTGIPVVASLMGLDAFPHDDPLFSGMIGTYGNRYANLSIANSDLVIALGTRLDTRQTGTRPETFARGAKIIHVDIDPFELDNKIKAFMPINSDLRDFLERLNGCEVEDVKLKIDSWKERINGYKRRYPAHHAPPGESIDVSIDPNYFMHILSRYLPRDAIICVDIGQNQMWSAQSLVINGTQRFLTQGGMASMGCALPMAIGASFAEPGKTVVAIAGDGGFQLNIQELQTVYHHDLPIKTILLNNSCYGMVRQFQEQYFDGRCQSTVIGYSCPDFQDVVSAYKIPSRRIKQNSEISDALEMLFNNMNPEFLEVKIDADFKVNPKLSVNRPVEDQDPLLSRQELDANMLIKTLPEPEKL
jgi:acetolactate synthase I/II/III large subunit